MDHGAGGVTMRNLVHDKFVLRFGNAELKRMNDGACLTNDGNNIVFTTDSYLIQPIIFTGGDIGSLAVSGTVNDLLVMGAKPRWLSVGLIIEEGFSLDQLDIIIESMAETAELAEIEIVTGDTKVVPRGQCDSIFINTSGIGNVPLGYGVSPTPIKEGDVIICSGTVGDHAVSILSSRLNMQIAVDVKSDCAPLTRMIGKVLRSHNGVKWMRDPTRGGLAACLDEFSISTRCKVRIREHAIPVSPSTQAVCDLLGYDPIHLANEGKVMLVVDDHQADAILGTIQSTEQGRNAAIIGEVVSRGEAGVVVETAAGGLRRLRRPSGELLPRIC